MLSPIRTANEKPGQKQRNSSELAPKEKDFISRLVAETETKTRKRLGEKGRRRSNSIESANNHILMSLVPNITPPNTVGSSRKGSSGDEIKPGLAIAKQFRRQTRTLSMEGVPKVENKEGPNRKKSSDRFSLIDRPVLKATRSSRSLSPRAALQSDTESPQITSPRPDPPPPTPRTPEPAKAPIVEVAPTTEPANENVAKKPQIPPNPLPAVVSRTDVGTSPWNKVADLQQIKFQTDEASEPTEPPPSSLAAAVALLAKLKKDAKNMPPKVLQGKLKMYLQSIRVLERLKNHQRREKEGLQQLPQFGIPDQHKLMGSLLENDSYKHNFNGYLRQYYSFILHSYCLMNMQGRYRGLDERAECFKLINISQLRSKEDELRRRRDHQRAKVEIQLDKLRAVARDSLHYRFLKEMAVNQAMTLPITIMHGILAEVTPVVENIWRVYVSRLGRLHQASNQCGRHYIRMQQRFDMYDHLGLGDCYQEKQDGK